MEIGGEVRALGKKPSGRHWLVGIEKPSATLGGGGLQGSSRSREYGDGDFRKLSKFC